MSFRNPRNQRFERAEQNHLRRQNKWGVKFLVVFVSVLVIGCVYEYNFGKPVKEVKKYQVSVPKLIKTVEAERKPDRLDKAIEVMKREVVISIRDKESRGFTPKSGEVFYTHDSPKSLRAECQRTGGERNLECESWGIMQMKIPTILLWNTKLGRAPMSEKEALLLALDNEKSVEFAEAVIFGIKGSCFAWTTCGSEEKEKIELIRELENIK